MAHFTVCFLKDVLGDQGQPCEACQRVIDIDAPDAPRWQRNSSAQLREIRDWSLHAHCIDVQPADFPS
ncbi:hypothetical protein [Bradyrhizobium sp. Gha]|uniref:hypothetical protein n=1 Tax=Bradyrhizobium sp. Gha TaxID=1855318 RepID=UPI0008F1EC89|nr:hypothetical protein [Bradyrhizobium sp. Gha]SFJ52239.1 hypothetical protein SAMN05216525_12747 [Bradyrhizobium sp. Gha]